MLGAILHVYGSAGEVKEYFERRIRERRTAREWCQQVVTAPLETMTQDDGRLRYWGFIDVAGRYLRVITEQDGTFVNAFFDRNFERRQAR